MSNILDKLDFGKEWFGMPCSDEYWNAIEPIFNTLKQKENDGIKWSEIEDKGQRVYIPLLQAFIDEMNRANKKDNTLPRKIIEHLIGIEDYYKVVSNDNERITMLYTCIVPNAKLPTRLVALEFKPNSDNTVEMYLDNGWQLSFEIYNSSLKEKSNLKFNVQFVSMPMGVLNIRCM